MVVRAWIGATLLAAMLLAAHILLDRQFSALRGKTFDIYQTLLPAPPVSSPVVLVAIDDAALQKVGRWPWSRGKIADLVGAVASNGSTAIGLDILLPEPDTGPGGKKADQRLAEALAASRSILAASIDNLPASTKLSPKAGWSLVGGVPQTLPAFGGLVASHPMFTSSASGLGIIRATPDSDGTLRQLPLLWLRSSGEEIQLWPSFALELVRIYRGEAGFTAKMVDGEFNALKIGADIIPLQAAGTINLRERQGSLPIVPAASLLDGKPAPQLAGAIAILMVSAVGLDQYHTTPAEVARLGAEIHGLVIEQILTQDFPQHPKSAKWIERLWFAAGSVLVVFLGIKVISRPWVSVPAMILVISSPFVAGAANFAVNSTFYESLQPAAALLLVAMTSGFANYRHAEQRRQSLTRQFSQFLSPAIVDTLSASDAEAMIKVEKREVTALMMDIRGFTAMTHTLAADEVVTVINHFLAIATDEILRRDGTIDKFMGDAVLAIWNAPIAVDDHADRAIATAMAIIKRIARSNENLTGQNLPALRVGAGLETGICSVGNFGSARRIDYTAIGDAINLAARLESATKTTGVPLLAGPGTAAAATIILKPVGPVSLQGFDERIEAFTANENLEQF